MSILFFYGLLLSFTKYYIPGSVLTGYSLFCLVQPLDNRSMVCFFKSGLERGKEYFPILVVEPELNPKVCAFSTKYALISYSIIQTKHSFYQPVVNHSQGGLQTFKGIALNGAFFNG